MDKNSLTVSFQRKGTPGMKCYNILLSCMLQEYLISEEIARAGLQQYYISPPEAHRLVAMSSITYAFQVDSKHHLKCFPSRHRLFVYCVKIGPLHALHAGHKHDDLQHLIGAFCEGNRLEPDKFLSIELLFDTLHQDPRLFICLLK